MALQRFKALGAVGFIADQHTEDVSNQPMGWTAVQNMRFRDGYAQKMEGHNAPHGAPLVTPYHIDFVQAADSTRYEAYAGLQDIYAVINSTHTKITRNSGQYTGTIDNRWTSAVMSNILLLSNGVDVPQYWGGNPASPCADMPSWPAGLTCKVIRTFNNYIFMLNITESGVNLPSTIRWSQSATPGNLPASFAPAATNDAGRVSGVLSSTPDTVVDGLQLGDQFMIYKDNSTYVAQYTGGQEIFSLRNISRASGCLAIECVAAFPGGHVVLADGDIVVHDGYNGPQSVINNRLRQWLFNNLDTNNRQRSVVVPNLRLNEIWFFFPLLGSTWNNAVLIWNYNDNTWGVRDAPNVSHANAGQIVNNTANVWTAAVDTWNNTDGVWGSNPYSQASKRLLMASVDPNLYLADITRSFNGTPMNASLERTGLEFGEPDVMKICRGVRPRIDAAAGTVINVQVGTQNDLDDAVTWSSNIPFTVGSTLKADCMVTGRFLGVRFSSSGQGPWRMSQFDLDIIEAGQY